jgi:hypothetical protein
VAGRLSPAIRRESMARNQNKQPYDIENIPKEDITYQDDDGTWMVQKHKEGWIIEPAAIYPQPEDGDKR